MAALVLENVELRHVGDATVATHDRYDLPGIKLPAEVVSRGGAIRWPQMWRQEGPSLDRVQASVYLGNLYRQFRNDCQKLLGEIAVERHCRLAFGVGCVVLVLLGAALGIVFRSGHLLSAFGISFIPAGLCLIAIFTGKHIAEQSGISTTAGIAFLWSGIAVVACANLFVYRHLLKR